jgi:adenosylhomocysteine nucleosidase
MATATPPSAKLLIVSGLEREAAIFNGPNTISICGDASTLRAKFARLADLPLRMVASVGICGGLDPALRGGDVVVGAEVVSGGESIKTDETIAQSLTRRLVDLGERAVVGRVAGTHAPVLTARAKAQLHTITGAVAVDMESLLAGRFALEQEVPFAILRAVSDPADRDLPSLALNAVAADGRINVAAAVGGLIRSPGEFPGLIAAARDSAAALRALGRCGRLPGLFLGLGLAHL